MPRETRTDIVDTIPDGQHRVWQSPQHAQTAQLHQFLSWLTPITFGFAILEGGAFLLYGDTATALVSLILAVYGSVLVMARIHLRSRRVDTAVFYTCSGMLVATLFAVPLEPDWVPTMAMIPLLSVTLALPYVRITFLRYFLLVVLLVTLGVALAGEVFVPHSTLPPWFTKSFHVVSLTAAVATVLLLLWQFSSRLTGMLALTRAAEERFALAAKGANDGLWDWDVIHDHVYYSPRWQAMVGEVEVEMLGSPQHWFDRIHPDDRVRVQAQMTALVQGHTDDLQIEHRMRHLNGSYGWMLNRGHIVRNEQGVAVRIAGSQTDITVRKQVEEQLRQAALHDALTGLPNRTLFLDRLGQAIERSKRHRDDQFVVLFLDMDRFKMINDSLGHAAGDQLLIALAARMTRILRTVDTVARLGGDEFTILLADVISPDHIEGIVEKLRQELLHPYRLDGHEVATTISMGIVHSSPAYHHADEMLRDADTALYYAKGRGGACSAVFDQTMHIRAVAQLQLEIDLRRAIDQQEFRVVYMPVVSLKTGRITGFEALARWDHPQRGVIAPFEFIPVAEETGLIIELDEWVHHTACAQLQAWKVRYPACDLLTVSVNVSGKQLVHPRFLSHLQSVLQTSGLQPQCLKVEITESMVLRYGSSTAGMYDAIRALGLQLQMDDFGTGYSSLSRLHELPIEALKIDQTFLQRIGTLDDHHEVVQAILSLAHQLGLHVIAEGVEYKEQLTLLRALDCDYGQGHYFGEAVDAASTEARIVADLQW